MRHITTFAYIILLMMVFEEIPMSFASRETVVINDNWTFRFGYQVQSKSSRRVDLPHTWNAQDALSGREDYYRGAGVYEKNLEISPEWKGKRLFLHFGGVNTVAHVFVNDSYIGEHHGGYAAFVFEITDKVVYGGNNKLTVRVSNALNLDVMPLVGDFNFYGGIYRDMHLIVLDEACISPTDYASPGVYLTQKSVTEERAEVGVKVMLSNSGSSKRVDVKLKIWDGDKLLSERSLPVDLGDADNVPATLDIVIEKPHLWNGRKDPFMYKAEVCLLSDGTEIDKVCQPLGLRFYGTDPAKGFFLNGEHLKLYGVCRHQDRAETGNALHRRHHREDVAIIAEMGANAVRLSHYQQDKYVFDLFDSQGFIVWAEIPFIGPGGYLDRGFVNSPGFRANGKAQLTELIRQNYNHPSICFWGLFNELKTFGDNPAEYVSELNSLAHAEDPSRVTASATFLEDANDLNKVTDLIAWNKYYGWYDGSAQDLAIWADNVHAAFPQFKLGLSEYGAGASIYHQQEEFKSGDAAGWWHPENRQTYYHIENWKAITERDFIWGSFLWNMFDFGAAHRREGDRPGINDKGLVTFDRKVRKDAFYFYKANWNHDEPFVYIAGRRNDEKTSATTDIIVFSNLPEVELTVNGKSNGKMKSDGYATFRWNGVALSKGKNVVEASSRIKKISVTDRITLNLNY
ncbi:MAG: glycoside hydrolase family 2 protein [Tannerella sp.]|nr:glycoside hydrolase family 2 protein [Tannerella sp.]